MRILPYLFPRLCTICSRSTLNEIDENLCNECYLELTFPLKKCIFCDTFGHFLCHLCKKQMPLLQDIHICFQYETVIKRLIQQLKFSLKPYIAISLSRIIWRHSADFIANIPLNTAIIPMPSGRLRIAKRGFNPVELITRNLSRRSDLRHFPHYLAKSAFSIPQIELSRNARLENLQSSFFLKTLPHKNSPPTSILLVDDVITTGRSFQKAIETLHNPHTKQLFGLFIAQS